jgi:hypothetical protein
MIRRLLVMAALALGILFTSAGSASAANVACAYNVQPLNVGLCIGV